jgi:alpha-D-ribose 1-methylphosphonate 5-triphosphate diphosphatase PhnM
MTTRTTVLILASGNDATADHVAAELASRGVPVLRTDTADFPTRLTLAATFGSRGGWDGTLRTDRHRAVSQHRAR